ncbi:MAG: hypothetical protein Alpg2KO_26200 [Alphaproteobacteria bacterium]
MDMARRFSLVALCVMALSLTGCLKSEAEKTQEAIDLAAAEVTGQLDYLDRALEGRGLRNANTLKLYADRMRKIRPDQTAIIDAMAEQAEPGNTRIEGYRKRLEIARTKRNTLPGSNKDDAAFEEIEAVGNAAALPIYNESLLDPINFLAGLSGGNLRQQKVPPGEPDNHDQKVLGAAGYLIGNEQYGRWEEAETVAQMESTGTSALSAAPKGQQAIDTPPAASSAEQGSSAEQPAAESSEVAEAEPSPSPESRRSGGGHFLWVWWPRYAGINNAMRWNQRPAYANYHYGRPWSYHDSTGRDLYGSQAERARHTATRKASDDMIRKYGTRTGRSATAYDTRSNSRFSPSSKTQTAKAGLSKRGARFNPRIKAAARAASAASSSSNKSSASKSSSSTGRSTTSTRSTGSSTRSTGSSSFRSSGSSGRSFSSSGGK